MKKVGINLGCNLIKRYEEAQNALVMSAKENIRKMIAYPNGKCNNVRRIVDFYRQKQIENSRDCQDFSEENQHLKKLLKRAVEKEFAPNSLVASIRSQIRR